MSVSERDKIKNNPTTSEEAILVCTPFVNKLAHKWKRNHTNEFNDLQQAGFIGVLEAWQRFEGSDYQRTGKIRFTSYAWYWIRFMVRDHAMRMWNYKNHTTDKMAVEDYDVASYSISDNEVQMLRNVEKLSKEDKKLYTMRLEGFTFQEISDMSEEADLDNLHKVRNRLQKLNKEMQL